MCNFTVLLTYSIVALILIRLKTRSVYSFEEKKKMPLEFSLYKNSMSRKGKYRAVVKNVKYVTVEDAIAALTKPGSILKETECYAVIHSLLGYINEQLAEGHGFESPYFRLKPGLKGVFEGEEDTYDPKRHKPRVNFRMGKTMKESLTDLKVKKI